LNERTGNVIENKGLFRKTPAQGTNLYENKWDILKIGNLIENKSGYQTARDLRVPSIFQGSSR